MACAAKRVVANTPFTLTSMTASNAASSILRSVRSLTMPALLISTSRRPKRSSAVWVKRSAVAQSETLPATPTAFSPIPATTSSTSAAFVPLTTTFAPSAASASAKARPRPRVDPVTMATFPSSSMPLLLRCRSGSWGWAGPPHKMWRTGPIPCWEPSVDVRYPTEAQSLGAGPSREQHRSPEPSRPQVVPGL